MTPQLCRLSRVKCEERTAWSALDRFDWCDPNEPKAARESEEAFLNDYPADPAGSGVCRGHVDVSCGPWNGAGATGSTGSGFGTEYLPPLFLAALVRQRPQPALDRQRPQPAIDRQRQQCGCGGIRRKFGRQQFE